LGLYENRAIPYHTIFERNINSEESRRVGYITFTLRRFDGHPRPTRTQELIVSYWSTLSGAAVYIKPSQTELGTKTGCRSQLHEYDVAELCYAG
jgi:hypothetical protein